MGNLPWKDKDFGISKVYLCSILLYLSRDTTRDIVLRCAASILGYTVGKKTTPESLKELHNILHHVGYLNYKFHIILIKTHCLINQTK